MELKIGDISPDFTGTDQNGKIISLSSLRGKKIILYFYPQDDTPGCTNQACNLRDNYLDIEKEGYVILGISPDNENSHQKFIQKYNIPFTLIADVDKTIHEKYGVWREKTLFGVTYIGTVRTTFVIDTKGYIEKIITNVNTKNHTEQIL